MDKGNGQGQTDLLCRSSLVPVLTDFAEEARLPKIAPRRDLATVRRRAVRAEEVDGMGGGGGERVQGGAG